jgi:hypothetical protein
LASAATAPGDVPTAAWPAGLPLVERKMPTESAATGAAAVALVGPPRVTRTTPVTTPPRN